MSRCSADAHTGSKSTDMLLLVHCAAAWCFLPGKGQSQQVSYSSEKAGAALAKLGAALTMTGHCKQPRTPQCTV